jgi:hypothetical protein
MRTAESLHGEILELIGRIASSRNTNNAHTEKRPFAIFDKSAPPLPREAPSKVLNSKTESLHANLRNLWK